MQEFSTSPVDSCTPEQPLDKQSVKYVCFFYLFEMKLNVLSQNNRSGHYDILRTISLNNVSCQATVKFDEGTFEMEMVKISSEGDQMKLGEFHNFLPDLLKKHLLREETEADHESLTDLHDGKVQTVGDLHNGATNPKDGLGGLTPEITSRSSAFWRRVNELLEKHKQSYVIVWNGAHSFFLQLTNLNVSGAYNCGPKKSEDLNLSSAIYYNCLLQINEVELYAIRKELEQQYGRMLWKLNMQDVNCTAIIKSANGRLSIDSMVLREEYRRMTPAKIHDWLSAALIDAPLDDFTKGFMFHLALNSDNNALYITCCDEDGFVRYSKTSDVIGNTDDVDSDADFEEPRVESSRPRLKVRNPPPIRIADLNNGNSVINTGNPPESDAHMDSLRQTFWPKIKEILEERRKSSVIVWSGAHSFFLQLMKLNVSDSTSCTLDDSLSPHLPPVVHYNCTLQIDEMELYAIRRELWLQYGRLLWNWHLRGVRCAATIRSDNGRFSMVSMTLRDEYGRMTAAKIQDWLSAALMDAPLDDFAKGFMFHLALNSAHDVEYISCCDKNGFVRYSNTFEDDLDCEARDAALEGPRMEASTPGQTFPNAVSPLHVDLDDEDSKNNTGNPPERVAHLDSLSQTFWPKIGEILEERRKSSVIVWSGAHSFFLQLMKLNVSDSSSCTLDNSLSPQLAPVLHYNCSLQIDEIELLAIRRELEPQYGRMLWNLALREVNFTVIIKLANGRLSIESMALREEYRRMTPAKIYDWLSAALMDAPLDDFAEGFMFHLALKSDNNALYITCCDEDGFVRYSSTFAESVPKVDVHSNFWDQAFRMKISRLLETRGKSHVVVWHGIHSFFLQWLNLNVSEVYSCVSEDSKEPESLSVVYYNCSLYIIKMEMYAIRKELRTQYGRMLWKLLLQDAQCTAIIKSDNGRLSIASMTLREEYHRMTSSNIQNWLSAALLDGPLGDFAEGFMFHVALNSDHDALYISCCDDDGLARYWKTPEGLRSGRSGQMEALRKRINEMLAYRGRSYVIIQHGNHTFLLHLQHFHFSEAFFCVPENSPTEYNCSVHIYKMNLMAILEVRGPQYNRKLRTVSMQGVRCSALITLNNGKPTIASMTFPQQYHNMTEANIQVWTQALMQSSPLDDFAEGFMFHLALNYPSDTLLVSCCDENGFVFYTKNAGGG